jgi:hypothetical protein
MASSLTQPFGSMRCFRGLTALRREKPPRRDCVIATWAGAVPLVLTVLRAEQFRMLLASAAPALGLSPPPLPTMLPLLRLRRLQSQQGLLLACAGDVARATLLRIAINIAGHVAVEVSRRHSPLGTGFLPNVIGKRALQVVIGVWSTPRAVDDPPVF